jgi:hypothetical protein
MSSDLVKKLRDNSSEFSLMWNAADRIEALEGEVRRVTELYEAGCKNWDPVYKIVLDRAERLRVALEEIKAFPQYLGVPTLTKLEDAFQRGLIAGHETCAAYARKALEDDKQ